MQVNEKQNYDTFSTWNKFNFYSRTPLIRPPSESHLSREGFIYFALLQLESHILGI